MIIVIVWLVVALIVQTICWWKVDIYPGERWQWLVWVAIWFWPPILAAYILLLALYYPICILLWPLRLDD